MLKNKKSYVFVALLAGMAINNPLRAIDFSALKNKFFAKKEDPVVTKPYTPSNPTIIDIHPVLSTVATAVIAGGLEYLLASKSEGLQKGISTGLGGGIGFGLFIYHHKNKRCLLDQLLVVPEQHVAQSPSGYINDQVDLILRDEQGQKVERFQKLVTAQESPISILGECTTDDCPPCQLSRTHRPQLRKKFEKHVVQKIVEKLNAIDKPIRYAGFASGGSFQDLIILVKFLVQNPQAKIDIDLIDVQHEFFVNVMKSFSRNRIVDADTYFDIWPVVHNIKYENFSEDQRALIFTWLEFRAKQFISYLQKTFPQAILSLSLYTSKDDYLTYLDNKKLEYPDVLVAADIDSAKAGHDYEQLCKILLKKKSDGVNAMLFKDEPGIASLIMGENKEVKWVSDYL